MYVIRCASLVNPQQTVPVVANGHNGRSGLHESTPKMRYMVEVDSSEGDTYEKHETLVPIHGADCHRDYGNQPVRVRC
jgi:hypothetical protein